MPVKPPYRGWLRRGFTLTELLLVIGILAIVTSLALPAWRNHIIKTRRTDAMALLMQVTARQEQFRLANSRYAITAELGPAPPNGLGILNAGGNYRLTISGGAAGAAYRVLATVNRAGPQAADDICWILAMDEAGRRWARNRAGADTTKTCWRS